MYLYHWGHLYHFFTREELFDGVIRLAIEINTDPRYPARTRSNPTVELESRTILGRDTSFPRQRTRFDNRLGP